MASLQLITLLTDLGTTDAYAGIVKGVLYAHAPAARIVDLTHAADRGSVHATAYLLAAACPYFGRGTAHLVLVDPSSASGRRVIAAEIEGQYVIAPDNGVAAPLLTEHPPGFVVAVENQRFLHRTYRHTFHSRLIYAPVAAALVSGAARLGDLGPVFSDWTQLPDARAKVEAGGTIDGKVVHVDRFGNLVTNVHASQLPATPRLTIGQTVIEGVRSNYGDVEPGAVLAIVGSTGHVEISVNRGSASERLFVSGDTQVRVDAG